MGYEREYLPAIAKEGIEFENGGEGAGIGARHCGEQVAGVGRGSTEATTLGEEKGEPYVGKAVEGEFQGIGVELLQLEKGSCLPRKGK